MNTLSVKELTKSFGANKVIDGISFDVPEGCIFGFIGANGAGKTTTMKMILGLLPSDSGEILVCGEKVSFGATKTNRHIGYLPDVPEFYGYMRPKEYLRLCGEIADLDSAENNRRVSELLDMVGLSEVNKKIGSFSRGMKQRLGMAQALLNEPKLLICDEPTSALDPAGRKEILDILKRIKGKTTVVFSTHILADVERICDRVAVLHKGKIVLEKAMDDLKIQHKSKSITLEYESEVDSDEILRVLGDNGLAPARVERADISIESLYLEVAK
ncbi:MAG: ABC transporter ATP-binding protein [Oscillospiraceae bacterium]|nr:ABC transporter ATP-binding protein [Oscillospiraceae bacterium]